MVAIQDASQASPQDKDIDRAIEELVDECGGQTSCGEASSGMSLVQAPELHAVVGRVARRAAREAPRRMARCSHRQHKPEQRRRGARAARHVCCCSLQAW